MLRTIKLYTEQRYDTHTDSNEETFQGKFCKKNGHVFIIFKEEDKENCLKITNHIKLSKDGCVSVRRMGDLESTLYFKQDKPYQTFYNTGQGSVELVFTPSLVSYKEEKSIYTLNLVYSINMGGSKLSDNIYRLEITPLAKV